MSPKYANKLSGLKVLVIGGSSGIGFGVAEALLEHGSTVIVSSSSEARLQTTVSRLEAAVPAAKGRVSAQACDLAGADAAAQVAALFAAVASRVGKLDHIVFTAGDGLAIRPLADWDLAGMQQAGAVRFFGAVLVAQHAAAALNPGPASGLTLTNGAVAFKPMPDWALLSGYMAGLTGLTRGLALDLAPLRVNCVCPGAVDTELWDPIRKAGGYEQLRENFKKGTLTGEVGTVEDLVESYLYLIKDKNVTGFTVQSDSGALLK